MLISVWRWRLRNGGDINEDGEDEMRWSHAADGLIGCALAICLLCSVNSVVFAEDIKHSSDVPSDFNLPAQLDKYGIAAVAAILLIAMWRTQERMSRSLENHEKILIELVREAATAGEKQALTLAVLCREIRARPCLKDIEKE